MVAEYYAWLASFSAGITAPLLWVSAQVSIPLISAFLLGVIGSLSPCQVTTNASALAYVSGEASRSGRIWAATGAYVLGKAAVYTLLGVLVIVLGRELLASVIPAAAPVIRKLLGPSMILLGLVLLGLVRPRFVAGQRVSFWLEDRARTHGIWGAFLLGVAFALSFCPTLFLLFFGYLIPLSLRDPIGLAFPGLFAAGAALPLIGFSGALALGRGRLSKPGAASVRWDRLVTNGAGVVFLLAGANDTLLSWFI